MLCYRCGSHVPDSAERCETCGQRQLGTSRMSGATGLRKKLNPALLAGAPYREGEVMAGRYLVKDAVGVGPLGYVLRAGDRELGIDVSVKLVHPRFVQTGDEREAFGRALEAARRFLHPSLTRLHEVGNDQGWPYFTYTFLDGLPLRRIIDSRLAKGQTFTLDEVEPILGQLMAALEAAHPSGAHGDLKAENILVLPDMLKVTDWGVATAMPRPPFVQAQREKAAHRHLAPEVLAGAGFDPRADVYSLGVLLGEMLTGLTPEDEVPELRLVNPELPDAIEGFYRRALSERPEGRFRSVREMFEVFAGLAEGKAGVDVPAAAPAAEGEEVVEDGFEVVEEAASAHAGPTAPPLAAPEPPAPPAESDFWSEVAPPEPPPPSPPVPDTTPTPVPTGDALWAGDDEEPAPPPEQQGAVEPEPAPPPEPPVPVRSLPTQPRLAERPALASPVVSPLPSVVPPAGGGVSVRPVVPAVGVWGPGARRTGAHVAVAVAAPEPAPVPEETPRPAPPPPALRTVYAPPPDLAEPPAVGHSGGIWSPGAALAELVSEIRAEGARGTVPDEAGGAAASARQLAAAQAVAEQRAARERLALMSATEEPTAPVPALRASVRPRTPRPRTARVSTDMVPRDRWLRWGLFAAVAFALGMAGAVTLAKVRAPAPVQTAPAPAPR